MTFSDVISLVALFLSIISTVLSLYLAILSVKSKRQEKKINILNSLLEINTRILGWKLNARSFIEEVPEKLSFLKSEIE
jgi:hypothetical protein